MISTKYCLVCHIELVSAQIGGRNVFAKVIFYFKKRYVEIHSILGIGLDFAASMMDTGMFVTVNPRKRLLFPNQSHSR